MTWPMPCPRCGEMIDHGFHYQWHLQTTHGLTKDEAVSESVAHIHAELGRVQADAAERREGFTSRGMVGTRFNPGDGTKADHP